MSSFLSNLFSGGAEREAANANRAAYSTFGTQANGYLDTGLGKSVGALTDANNSAGDYLSKNYGLYGDFGAAGAGILDAGKSAGLGALGQANAAYNPLDALAKKYGAGTSLYLDSLGVNGASGNANAVNAFHTAPGYDFTRDQGLDAINRRRAAAGMLGSGNADIDAIKFGTGLADQAYGGWQDRLAGFVNPELSATSGAAAGHAGVASNMANLNSQDTLTRLGLAQGVTQGQAGVNTAQGNNAIALGNSLGNLYNQDAQNRTNVAGTVTGGNVSANNLQAQGEAQGARNGLGAALAVAQMGVSAATGGMGGGGGSFSSLFSNPTANGYNVGSTGGGNPFPMPYGGNAGSTYATGRWA